MHFVGSSVGLKSFYLFCLHSTLPLVLRLLFMGGLHSELGWETDPVKKNPFFIWLLRTQITSGIHLAVVLYK